MEGLSEELRGVEVERDGLKSACAQSQLEEEQLREALQSCEDELQRIQTEQQVDSLSSHQESWNAERSRLLASLEDMEEKVKYRSGWKISCLGHHMTVGFLK